MLHMTYKEILAHYGCQIRARVQIFQTFAQHGSQDRALAQKVLVHNCTIFLCSLDVRNIDDQCRGPSIKEKDHLVG